MLDVDTLLRPYLDRLAEDVGGLALYDAHTHVGANDPDGFTQTPEQLLRALGAAGARAEATRALDAGARGIKLHPRAERFGLDEPGVRDVVALAHERRVPVLIHAGRGIPALGRHTVALSGEFPGAKLILAHGAISD